MYFPAMPHTKEKYRQHRAAGKCGSCGLVDAEPNKACCRKCLDYQKSWHHSTKSRPGRKETMRRKSARTYVKLRQGVLTAYGRCCACCGTTVEDFLTVDHIHGGGRQHEKEIGTMLYWWLKRREYPEGFRILCWNCNRAAYYHGGECPHHPKGDSNVTV